MEQNKADIQSIIDSGDLEGALDAIDRVEGLDDDADMRLLRGRVLWRLGRYGEAISEYEHAVALDDDSPARMLLQQSREIMNYYNKDLYNP